MNTPRVEENSHRGPAPIPEQPPLGRRTALAALGRCVATTAVLLARRRIHLPREHVGMRLRFADGSSSCVYRETVAGPCVAHDPCLLVVAFRLRAVRGRGHQVFRWESLLNTPLFVGFPGFLSKLWVAHDRDGVYRGVYEWDGPSRAEFYARSLWHVLALVSVPGSIHYTIVPGVRRDDVLADPRCLGGTDAATGAAGWWRPVESLPRASGPVAKPD